MKHFFLTSVFFFTVLLSSFQITYAQYVVECPLCSKVTTQIPQFAKDIINTASNLATQSNTYFTYLQQSVLDPLANALIIVTQIQQQKNTINLITGSLGGNSLLIQNPGQWVQNKGLNSVRVNIGDISQQNGTYSSSILGSVINSYRGTSNLTNVLSSLGNSSIPNIVQNNLCKDASLSNVAKNDVMKSDGTYDLEAYQNRKQDLFNSLCVGNPTINIPLARKLEAVGKQRPDIAGPDSLLAVSFGDNEYNRSVRTQVAIAQNKKKEEDAAEADLNRGGGIASATRCDQPATADGSDIANIPCRVESITNTGSALNSAFQEAINAPLKKLMEAFGPGAGKSIASILSLVSSARQLDNAFDGTPSGSTAVQISDLTDPAQQKQTSGSASAPLQAHLASLSPLENTERDFIAQLSAYKNSVQAVQVCYEKLEEDFNLKNDPRVISALSFTSNKLIVIGSMQEMSTKNLNSIGTTRTLINDTLLSMGASQSTGEIIALFNDYQKKIDTPPGLPGISTASIREGDLITFKSDVSQETSSTGTITALNTQCAQIRQSYEQSNQSGGDGGGTF